MVIKKPHSSVRMAVCKTLFVGKAGAGRATKEFSGVMKMRSVLNCGVGKFVRSEFY